MSEKAITAAATAKIFKVDDNVADDTSTWVASTAADSDANKTNLQ